jgi:uncharacterized protein
MVERIGRWMAKNAPKREDLEKSRWMRVFGSRVLHSEFWRFTRRSVPRGVGVGLFVGIFALIPGIQIIGASLMSIPFRANIPIAAAMTFLTNPATTPFLLVASIWVGNKLGFHADLASFQALYSGGASLGDWAAWAFSDAAPAVISGLFIIAAASGIVGWAVSRYIWRWWQGRKWRRRALHRARP